MISTQAEVDESLSRVERRKAKTNRRFLEVALQLFSRKGIYWATVEDITELADQGKGTFYKYFDSKEAIILALLEEGLDELSATTERVVQDIPVGPARLSRVIEVRVDFFLNHPEQLLFLHQVRGMMQLDVEVAKELREVYNSHLRSLAQLVRPASEGNGRARELATAIAAYTSGLLTYYLLFEGEDGVKRRRKYVLEVLEGGLQPLLKNGNGSR